MANRRERVPVESDSFSGGLSIAEARRIEKLTRRFSRSAREIVALSDQGFDLAAEMMPRVECDSMFPRDTTLANAMRELRNDALGKPKYGGPQSPERPIVEDTLDEVKDRRITRVRRRLELEGNIHVDPLRIALAETAARASDRITKMVRDHYQAVPVSDGELDDGPMGSYG